MIVKKNPASQKEVLVEPTLSKKEGMFIQLDRDLTLAAIAFEETYRDFHSVVNGKAPASLLVSHLQKIGEELASKIGEELSDDDETKKGTYEFVQATFKCIGKVVADLDSSEVNKLTPDTSQEQSLLKIGISAGILSGLVSNNDVIASFN